VSPEVAFTGYDAGVSMFAGPALKGNSFLASKTFRDLRDAARERLSNEEALRETPASDDWPFLYLRRQAMPLEYWFIIALITGISALWIVTAVGREGLKRFSWHFFFLGAAFLLIEVKNLVSFSLIFGSTWQVNNLAIGGILVMILLANMLAAKKTDLGPYVPYALLAIVLFLGLFITAEDFVGLSPTMQALVVPLYLSLPIFCAGLVFIRSFSLAAFPAAALGANIIGGICGGLMENASLAWGFSALQVAAIVLYGLSFASMWLESRN
jgi:hypothetical protein